jgi:hypothetical protein
LGLSILSSLPPRSILSHRLLAIVEFHIGHQRTKEQVEFGAAGQGVVSTVAGDIGVREQAGTQAGDAGIWSATVPAVTSKWKRSA